MTSIIQADSAAQFINTRLCGPINNYLATETDGLIMKNEKQILIQNSTKFIQMQVKWEITKEYLQHKNKWSKYIINAIDWQGMEGYLKGLTIQKRLSTLQLIHNWQNTGQQKALFANAKQKHKDDADQELIRLMDEQI